MFALLRSIKTSSRQALLNIAVSKNINDLLFGILLDMQVLFLIMYFLHIVKQLRRIQ